MRAVWIVVFVEIHFKELIISNPQCFLLSGLQFVYLIHVSCNGYFSGAGSAIPAGIIDVRNDLFVLQYTFHGNDGSAK